MPISSKKTHNLMKKLNLFSIGPEPNPQNIIQGACFLQQDI